MSLFYRWENQVPEKLSNMSKVTQNPSQHKNLIPRPVFSSTPLPIYPLLSSPLHYLPSQASD